MVVDVTTMGALSDCTILGWSFEGISGSRGNCSHGWRTHSAPEKRGQPVEDGESAQRITEQSVSRCGRGGSRCHRRDCELCFPHSAGQCTRNHRGIDHSGCCLRNSDRRMGHRSDVVCQGSLASRVAEHAHHLPGAAAGYDRRHRDERYIRAEYPEPAGRAGHWLNEWYSISVR